MQRLKKNFIKSTLSTLSVKICYVYIVGCENVNFIRFQKSCCTQQTRKESSSNGKKAHTNSKKGFLGTQLILTVPFSLSFTLFILSCLFFSLYLRASSAPRSGVSSSLFTFLQSSSLSTFPPSFSLPTSISLLYHIFLCFSFTNSISVSLSSFFDCIHSHLFRT